MEERLQKIISKAGYGSRRFCEEIINSGRVRVNGRVATIGDKADLGKDEILVDGNKIKGGDQKKLYIALHKPRFVLSDSDPKDDRTTINDLVGLDEHLFAVGRLDFESEGLILLTNDGELANKLTHPRYGHEKEYRVLVAKRPDQEQLSTWRRGVVLEDGTKTRPADVIIESTFGKGAWLRIILKEGKKRQIREVGKLIGLPIVRIIRIRIGTLYLGNLKTREWRHLLPSEIEALRSMASPKSERKPVIRNARVSKDRGKTKTSV